ncbi:MAG: transposase [Mangrovibacterium sp.]
MMDYVEKYRLRFGCYPREALADQIYCTRVNRAALKEKGIRLLAKPLGRSSAVANHVSPGERNPVEGKLGQAKTAYGSGPGFRTPVNHGLPASSWCSTWSSWPEWLSFAGSSG